MADHTHATGGEPSHADMKGHAATYSNVISMLKWGAVGCFVIAFMVIWLIYK